MRPILGPAVLALLLFAAGRATSAPPVLTLGVFGDDQAGWYFWGELSPAHKLNAGQEVSLVAGEAAAVWHGTARLTETGQYLVGPVDLAGWRGVVYAETVDSRGRSPSVAAVVVPP